MDQGKINLQKTLTIAQWLMLRSSGEIEAVSCQIIWQI